MAAPGGVGGQGVGEWRTLATVLPATPIHRGLKISRVIRRAMLTLSGDDSLLRWSHTTTTAAPLGVSLNG